MVNVKVFCASKSCQLFLKTCSILGVEPCYLNKVLFANGEISIVFPESIKGFSIILFFQQTDRINADLIELLFAVYAAKTAGALRIIIVYPCSPYARQNRVKAGIAPTIPFIWQLLAQAGATDWITVDLHEPILSCKTLRIHNLSANNLLLEAFKTMYSTNENWICMAADEGAFKRARLFANNLNIASGCCKKVRENTLVKIEEISGDVAQKSVLLVDDMIDSGATLQAAIKCLQEQGARRIVCAVTHGIMREEIFSKLTKKDVDCLIETDTLPILEKGFIKNLKIVSVAPLLSQTLQQLIF